MVGDGMQENALARPVGTFILGRRDLELAPDQLADIDRAALAARPENAGAAVDGGEQGFLLADG
jgi:hypothetical protein